MKKNRIIALVLALLMTVSVFVGCGISPETAAELTIEKTFGVFKSDNAAEIREAMSGSNASQFDNYSDNLIMMFFKNLDYTINNIEVIDDSTVKVNMAITNSDMKVVFEDFMEQATAYAMEHLDELADMTDEDYQKMTFDILEDCLSKEDLPTTTITLDVTVSCVDDVWNIETTDEFVDAVLGGFVTAADSMNG